MLRRLASLAAGLFAAVFVGESAFASTTIWGLANVNGSAAFQTFDLASGVSQYGVYAGGALNPEPFNDIRAIAFAPAAPPTAVPEPAAWLVLIAGFGLAGAALRRKPAFA